MIVSVRFTFTTPTNEFGALFEGRLTLFEESCLTDADFLQRGAHRRPGTFANANDGNVGGFNQGDIERGAMFRCQYGRSQPSRCTATQYHNLI